MRIVELGLWAGAVMGFTGTGFAGLMYPGSSVEANFDNPSVGLMGQLSGWSGAGPTLANGKAELYGTRGNIASHSLSSSGGFVNSGTAEVDVGFTLIIHEVKSVASLVPLIQIIMDSGITMSVYATASDMSGVSLRLFVNSDSASESIFVPLNTPTRLVLSTTAKKSGTFARTGYLTQVIDQAGTIAPNTSALSYPVSPSTPSELQVLTQNVFEGTMDDVLIGNSKSDVWATPHSPEPATALLSLPMVAGLMLRRKSRA